MKKPLVRKSRWNTALKYGVLFGIQFAMIFVCFYVVGNYLFNRYPDKIVPYFSSINLKENKHFMKSLARQGHAMWTTIPDPLVGRIGIPFLKKNHKQAMVHFNNAGLRSIVNFGTKKKSVYRIVCLGDSYVMGEGGEEKDRFCNQIQDYFTKEKILVEGKVVETQAVGLSSWTMIQEANYLRNRLTAYDPDLVIVLTVDNDITTSSGVNGYGQLTADFFS